VYARLLTVSLSSLALLGIWGFGLLTGAPSLRVALDIALL
jgi:hypothetical protein